MERQSFSISGRPLAKEPYHYLECGLDNIFLQNGFTLEPDEETGEDYVSIENIDDLWKTIGLTLVCRKKAFDPKEVRFLRNLMGNTQSELATLLRVTDQTVLRWENGRNEMPGPADFALRVLFLASKAAQPDGNKILLEWTKQLTELVRRDAPECEKYIFNRHNHAWSNERMQQAYA